jgi:hypothetical protein
LLHCLPRKIKRVFTAVSARASDNILRNPYVNVIFVLRIEIHSFVELIKGYKMHYLGLNYEGVEILKMASARKHFETLKISQVKCAFFFKIFAYLLEISLDRYENAITERVLVALSTGSL